VIAFIGLYGLTAFSVERKMKEIGVRKVLGASAASVVGLIARDLSRPVILANLIAWPVGYWRFARGSTVSHTEWICHPRPS
jgi:putative ABC transport system permease protein